MIKVDLSLLTSKSSIIGNVVSFPVPNMHIDHCLLPAMQEYIAWCYITVFFAHS